MQACVSYALYLQMDKFTKHTPLPDVSSNMAVSRRRTRTNNSNINNDCDVVNNSINHSHCNCSSNCWNNNWNWNNSATKICISSIVAWRPFFGLSLWKINLCYDEFCSNWSKYCCNWKKFCWYLRFMILKHTQTETRFRFCIEHAKELKNAVPTKPFYFLKPTSSYLSYSSRLPIILPNGCDVHHEGFRMRKKEREKNMNI